MHSLFLNIASHEGLIACADDQSVVAEHVVEDRMSDDQIIPAVEEVLKKAGWSYGDLTHLACVIGPGGFTSLRMAVSMINTLSAELSIPSAGVHLSDYLKARCREEDVLWLHATKRDQLFIRGFGAYAEQWPEPTLITLDQAVEQVPSKAFWMGELLSDQQNALAEKNLQEADLQPAEEILPSFVSSLSYSTDLLLPWYGREG